MMAQVFSPSANVLSRLSLVIAVAAPVILLLTGSGITRSSANTNVDIPLDQPVPFSHQHHIAELGIDCRYCHTGVEKSAFAGIPPTQTCMSCHSQIWTNSPLLEPIRKSYAEQKPIQWENGDLGWNRVNKLPEFVYFNHSIHINRGVNCNQCHGAVQKMQITYKGKPFFMSWCLECHSKPESYLYKSADADKRGLSPRQQVFDLYKKARLGMKGLSDRERSLMNGEAHSASAAEEEAGKAVVNKAHVMVKQMTDCWICHR